MSALLLGPRLLVVRNGFPRGSLFLALVAAPIVFFTVSCLTTKQSSATYYPPYAAQGGAETPQELPNFPWPPPEPATKYSIKLWNYPATFKDCDNLLSAALAKAGYSEMSYFQVPGGFALVTRLEGIEESGCPLPPPARWTEGLKLTTIFSLQGFKDYLRDLLGAHSGTYRVNVFIVTSEQFATSQPPPTKNEATSWLTNGLNTLPQYIATNTITPDYTLSVLIYEFSKSAADGQVEVLTNGAPATSQLRCTGIALGRVTR